MIPQGVAIGEAARQKQRKSANHPLLRADWPSSIPLRTDGNRRYYTAADLRRLAFIRHARELGFDVKAIRALLTLQDDLNQPCSTADAIARARLAEVEQRIRSLTALKTELELMIEGCRGNRIAECRIIEVLADHGKCVHSNH